jgi:Flp pilus assembly protein TadD
MKALSSRHSFPVLLAVAALLASSASLAAGGYKNSKINESFRNGSMLVEYAMYKDAIVYLKKADSETPNNADVNNLLGYSHRKLEQFDKADSYYQKALAIDPKHRGALEYLGQLYVDTGQLGKARQQLARLDAVCRGRCDEFKSLKKAIEAKTSLAGDRSAMRITD